MKDIETVIEGLERCLTSKCGTPCPYYKNCLNTSKWGREVQEDAIELLKAQVKAVKMDA